MFERAYKFVYEQRLAELKRAQQHWPDSDKYQQRQQEISDLESKIEQLNQKLLSS